MGKYTTVVNVAVKTVAADDRAAAMLAMKKVQQSMVFENARVIDAKVI